MINIPLTPFPFQFLSRDTISFYYVKGTLVKPQNSAQPLFSLDFPLDQRIIIYIYIVLTFLISINGNLTYVYYAPSFFICVAIGHS